MSHYTVLITSKTNDIQSFYKLMSENNWSYPDDPEPFGFDYLAPLDKEENSDSDLEPYIFHKSEVEDIDCSMIIDCDGNELWWSNGISDTKPDIDFNTALSLIPEDHWCCLFDGHL